MAKILSLLLLIGCTGQATQVLSPNVFYKRELYMEINDQEAVGTAVVPKAAKYKIKIKFPGQGDLVTIKTCHRETEEEKLGRRETIHFTPSPGMEDTGKCFLEIAAFEHQQGRHAWGVIDFDSPQFSLPALIRCNGDTYNSRGTTICQSKLGLVQEIRFAEPVRPTTSARCGTLPLSEDKTVVEFKMPGRDCTFLYKGLTTGRIHKLTTIGYEKIIVREL